MDHRLQLQELWHLNGGGGETQTPSGEEQEDQLDEERCAGLQEVKRSRKAIENKSSAEALFSAARKNQHPKLIIPVSNYLNYQAKPPTALNTAHRSLLNSRPWHPHAARKDSQAEV